MKSFIWKRSIFLLLAAIAYLANHFGRVGWHQALVYDHGFPVLFGWLDVGTLISWSFSFLLFFAVGSLWVVLFGLSNSRIWVAALGLVCGLTMYTFSYHWFSSDPEWFEYFWIYGAYFVPVFGAISGQLFAQALARWRKGR